jgi:hypothetical protein
VSQSPTRLFVTEAPLAEPEVTSLRSAQHAMPPALAADDAQPRETSWRDLVRRLAKNPAKG